MLDEFIAGLKKEQNATKQQWSTKGGVFSTDTRCAVPFNIVDFATNKRVDWTFYIDNQPKTSSAGYDMIIGRDLLCNLGIDIKFSSRTLKWEDTKILMWEFGALCDWQNAYHCYDGNDDIVATKHLTKQAVHILDSKCKAINVAKAVAEQAGLNTCQKAALHALLSK
jgi:hypothetical protein